uniref:SEC7 domain-containing protein n=1 Tax=Ananas comosus var. bracteatus TaxID=296719 RepID=A0A6V7QEV6_ANACO|nr:unnamed protein product [Ananas comosus var. bracteatus]
MGRPRLQNPSINPIEEEPSDAPDTPAAEAAAAPPPELSALACVVNSEVSAVLAVIRRYLRLGGGRYGSSAAAAADEHYLEHPLVLPLKSLRRHSVALSAVHKILTLDAAAAAFAGSPAAIHGVVEAVASCRLDDADPAAEEAVLMRKLHVLLACMRARPALSDRHVCTIVNTCYGIADQVRAREGLLKELSRHTLLDLVRCIFGRLPDAARNIPGPPPAVKPQMGGINKDQYFANKQAENGNGTDDNPGSVEAANGGGTTVQQSYGIPCAVEVFQFLCSRLNVSSEIAPLDEETLVFGLTMINSAIELGGPSFRKHPKLLALIQDELFKNLMSFALLPSPPILSMVCSIVLNLYHHLRTELKLQLEAFFSCVILKLSQPRFGATYNQQEAAMEALVDFCRQKTFMRRLIQGMADRIGNAPSKLEQSSVELEEYTPFWTVKCENYSDPDYWVKFVRQRKYIKRRLMIGADHFNRDPKKGLEFLQGTHLLPEKLDPQSVACFFRYTAGLDKNLVGDFLGNHDEFCVQVLHEFARTFDFEGMNLDTALRLFLETFRLPGESQKIQRVLEAFSERYYEQSPHILANKDAALLLSYSLIMLNTDQHNVQVKKKMTEEDFIRNNRLINGGSDLPREFLSELYHSICKNEIRTIPEQGFGFFEMSYSRWVDLMRKSKSTSPYIVCDSRPFLDHDMFAIMSGPTIAAIAVVFDYAEHEEVLLTCVDGFLAVAKISAFHHLEDVLDDLVVSLCKFTTLSNSSLVEEPVTAFGDDMKARLATETVFNIANRYGDYIRTGWRNILECILRLHKLGLLPARVASDAADDLELASETVQGKSAPASLSTSHLPIIGTPRRSSGLMGRFSQLLSLDTEEPRSQPTEQQLAAHQRTLQTIQKCRIDSIFTESKFLQADSLLQLARALIWAAGRPQKVTSSPDDEDTAVFCLDFGLLRICQRLLPYKENLADELLRSLQLVLKLDARVADAYCENITQEVSRLVTVGLTDRSIRALDLMADSVNSLARWSRENKEAGEEAEKVLEGIREMWLRSIQAVRKLCLDQRETDCTEPLSEGLSEHGGVPLGAMRLLAKIHLQLLPQLFGLSSFCKLWLGVLSRMEKYMKVKVRGHESERDSCKEEHHWRRQFVELTWLHVNNISTSLQSEVFPGQESEQELHASKQTDSGSPTQPDNTSSGASAEVSGDQNGS